MATTLLFTPLPAPCTIKPYANPCPPPMLHASRFIRQRPSFHFVARSFAPLPAKLQPALATSQPSDCESNNSRFAHQHVLALASHMVLEILAFLWRLPRVVVGFLRKEENFINEVEEDVDKTADVAKIAAKAMEEVAEGLEKVGLEKIAKVIEDDAERIDTFMDKVKATNKTVHNEVEDGIGRLDSLVEEMEEREPGGEVEVEVTQAKEGEGTQGETSLTKEIGIVITSKYHAKSQAKEVVKMGRNAWSGRTPNAWSVCGWKWWWVVRRSVVTMFMMGVLFQGLAMDVEFMGRAFIAFLTGAMGV